MDQNLFNDDCRAIKNYSLLLNYTWYLRTVDLTIIMEKLCDLLSEYFPNVTATRIREVTNIRNNLTGKFTFVLRRDYIINRSPVRMFMCYVDITDEFRNSESETYAIIVRGHGNVISYKEFKPDDMKETFNEIVSDIKEYEEDRFTI